MTKEDWAKIKKCANYKEFKASWAAIKSAKAKEGRRLYEEELPQPKRQAKSPANAEVSDPVAWSEKSTQANREQAETLTPFTRPYKAYSYAVCAIRVDDGRVMGFAADAGKYFCPFVNIVVGPDYANLRIRCIQQEILAQRAAGKQHNKTKAVVMTYSLSSICSGVPKSQEDSDEPSGSNFQIDNLKITTVSKVSPTLSQSSPPF